MDVTPDEAEVFDLFEDTDYDKRVCSDSENSSAPCIPALEFTNSRCMLLRCDDFGHRQEVEVQLMDGGETKSCNVYVW
jgi:hypothetical protein